MMSEMPATVALTSLTENLVATVALNDSHAALITTTLRALRKCSHALPPNDPSSSFSSTVERSES